MFFGQNKNQNAANNPVMPAAGADIVFEGTVNNFEDAVIRASLEGPVVAYFTAGWCGPCKQLGPVLERAVREAGGAVSMAKIDIDQNQELAAALRIQSVPTIYLFFQGRPVDGFQGALPESQVKAFIDKAVQMARASQPDALDIPEALKVGAEAMATRDYERAQGVFGQILQQDPKNIQAFSGMVRALIALDQADMARGLMDGAPPDMQAHAQFKELQTALELALMKPQGSLEAMAAKLAQNPGDHQARFDLALAQFVAGAHADAMDNLLEIVARAPKWNDEAARKQLLKFFEALGNADPLTAETRRRLSSLLFS